MRLAAHAQRDHHVVRSEIDRIGGAEAGREIRVKHDLKDIDSHEDRPGQGRDHANRQADPREYAARVRPRQKRCRGGEEQAQSGDDGTSLPDRQGKLKLPRPLRAERANHVHRREETEEREQRADERENARETDARPCGFGLGTGIHRQASLTARLGRGNNRKPLARLVFERDFFRVVDDDGVERETFGLHQLESELLLK